LQPVCLAGGRSVVYLSAWLLDSLFAQNGAEGNGIGTSLLGPWIPLILIGFLFYFMLIRPERRKRVAVEAMQQSLKKNDRVLTFSGIYGTVVNASQESPDVTIRVDESSNTKLRILRSSIQSVLGETEGDGSTPQTQKTSE
jgi:preprotein translocase subunit YajC